VVVEAVVKEKTRDDERQFVAAAFVFATDDVAVTCHIVLVAAVAVAAAVADAVTVTVDHDDSARDDVSAWPQSNAEKRTNADDEGSLHLYLCVCGFYVLTLYLWWKN